MSTFTLVRRQIKYQNLVFWRNPAAAFFTVVFPLMFFFVFTLIFGNEEIPGSGVTTAQFYGPTLAVFAAVSATYTNLAIGTAIARDDGLLKRVRSTPMPPWVYLAGRIGSAIEIAFISAGIMLGVGVLFYGVNIYAVSLLGALITFVIGIAVFAVLGLLLAGLSPNGNTAPALTNATLLPLAFISDVFIPPSANAPAWLSTVADLFPLRHFAVSFGKAFNPLETTGASVGDFFDLKSLGVMLLWGVVGAILALRFFKWNPQAGSKPSKRRRGRTRT
ncbi:MAG: ABC transporter permease [Actinobacteria bacterium]|uniref:ABC transmembrane type-2 domain-containing protein n=1 Tax=hydrothermal vent metagenome TaxID=652676 RepID=A0A3B0RJZ2_9ZZZZ|nr:ABC transporter permease [Actinomycetota bacterium]